MSASASATTRALDADAYARPRLVAPLARWLLGIFFRRLEVSGADKVPRRGPVVFVANHINALVDPALLLSALPIRPRFLAKSTLWANPVVRPFLRLAAAIPVYRRQDAGADTAKNAEMFVRCHEVLAAAGSIALFPEGRSHNEPALVSLKTGVSRIVLEAERKYPGLGVRIVPVGLTFEEKGRFRSRVLVAVGEPLVAAPELAIYDADPSAAVRSLTARIRQALTAVTLNYPSWQEARLIERAVELFQRPASELPAELTLEDELEVSRAFIDGYETLRQRYPQKVAAVAAAVEAYDELLAHCGLQDRQVASTYPSRGVARFVGHSLLLMSIRLPLAFLGTILNAPPYRAVRWVAERWGKTADLLATYKLFGSLIFYPLTWLLETLAAALVWGLPGALGMLVLAPSSAWLALRFHERREHFGREARAYLLLRSQRRSIVELKRRRGEILSALHELAVLYQQRREAAPDAS